MASSLLLLLRGNNADIATAIPVNMVAPVIAQSGDQIVLVSAGVWTGGAVVKTYDIALPHTLAAGEYLADFTVVETGTNGLGSDTASSNTVIPLVANVPASFVATWDTTKTSTGSSTATQVKLPLALTGTYDFYVDWGDGSALSHITSYNQAEVTHTYASSGIYTIATLGTLIGFIFNNTGDKLKIKDVSQWGQLKVGTTQGYYFYGCANLTASSTDVLDVSAVTKMHSMFYNATSFNQNISAWNVSAVTIMQSMFQNATSFNQNISAWNVSAVTTMANMFLSVTLSTANYDALLIGWASQVVKTAVPFHAGNSKYTAGGAAATARGVLTGTYAWTITDGGTA